MRTAVIAWGETIRQQALMAVSALELLDVMETELWVFENDIKKRWLLDLPFQNVYILDGFGNLHTGTGQYVEEFLNLFKEHHVNLAVFPDNEKGGELAVRVSLGLGTAAALKVTEIRIASGDIFLERKVYSCNLDGCFRAPRNPFAMTFDINSVKESATRGAPAIHRKRVLAAPRQEFLSCEEIELPGCQSLETSERLVAVGRGAADRETVELLRQIAQILDAGLGATRPAVLEALLPYSNMIGMTGVIARPKLCMAFGASGSAPFMIGVRDSRFLVGVNRDPDAAVFRSCNLAVVDDAGEFAAAFLDVLREKEGK